MYPHSHRNPENQPFKLTRVLPSDFPHLFFHNKKNISFNICMLSWIFLPIEMKRTYFQKKFSFPIVKKIQLINFHFAQRNFFKWKFFFFFLPSYFHLPLRFDSSWSFNFQEPNFFFFNIFVSQFFFAEEKAGFPRFTGSISLHLLVLSRWINEPDKKKILFVKSFSRAVHMSPKQSELLHFPLFSRLFNKGTGIIVFCDRMRI